MCLYGNGFFTPQGWVFRFFFFFFLLKKSSLHITNIFSYYYSITSLQFTEFLINRKYLQHVNGLYTITNHFIVNINSETIGHFPANFNNSRWKISHLSNREKHIPKKLCLVFIAIFRSFVYPNVQIVCVYMMGWLVMICDRARNKFSRSGQPFYGYVICSLYC